MEFKALLKTACLNTAPVLMDIASAAPEAQEAQGWHTEHSKTLPKTNPSTQAMCIWTQQLLVQKVMWPDQGASAYAWCRCPWEVAGENPSQSDQTVRSFSCRKYLAMLGARGQSNVQEKAEVGKFLQQYMCQNL